MTRKRMGWVVFGVVVTGWLVGVPAAMALEPGPEPDCMAPCSINPQTGEMDCPCDGVGDVHTPEPASALLCGLGALGLALKTSYKRPLDTARGRQVTPR